MCQCAKTIVGARCNFCYSRFLQYQCISISGHFYVTQVCLESEIKIFWVISGSLSYTCTFSWESYLSWVSANIKILVWLFVDQQWETWIFAQSFILKSRPKCCLSDIFSLKRCLQLPRFPRESRQHSKDFHSSGNIAKIFWKVCKPWQHPKC